MVEVVLQEVGTYLSCRHNIVTQFIATRPIMDLCLAAARIPGSRVANRRWEKGSLYLEGICTASQEAERMEGWKETDRTETETY